MTATPVLLTIFNRADHVRASLEKLRDVRPSTLYVAADGPRRGNAADETACAEARAAVVVMVDWPCDLKLRFQDKNLGVRKGVTDAIDWLFANERQGIILEDDILAEPEFFQFCDELLERYRDDPRVAAISGTSYQQPPAPDSYRASSLPDIWGWATWRDRWLGNDNAMSSWPRFGTSGGLARMPGATRRFERYWHRIFDETKSGKINSWAYRWILTQWVKGTVALHPAVPLVTNIGFGEQASNTKVRRPPRYCRPPRPLSFPLKHPTSLEPDRARERAMWAFRFHLSATDALVFAAKTPLRIMRDWWRATARRQSGPILGVAAKE